MPEYPTEHLDLPIIIKDSGDYDHARAKRDQYQQMASVLKREIECGCTSSAIRGHMERDLAEAQRYQDAMDAYDGIKRRRKVQA